ncbi:hypothetical protein ACROYT_G025794 [Oculina patagonica]
MILRDSPNHVIRDVQPQGRDTLGDESSVCTDSKRLFGAQTVNGNEWVGMPRFVADVYTRCDNAAITHFVAAMCRTNSNQFEFVRHIAATKFCRSDLFVARMHYVTRGDMSLQHVAVA